MSQPKKTPAALTADLFDDDWADCFQEVCHIIDYYGQPSPRDGSRAYTAGDLLLARTGAGDIVVRFRGREVMRVPAVLGSAPCRWDPTRCWVDAVDRLYEGMKL
jgi:hypothetical protein